MSPQSLPPNLTRWLQTSPYDEIHGRWLKLFEAAGPACLEETQAALGRADRFYLLTELLNRPDADRPWLYARCREVEASPDGHLDLWAREHYKSTIITFAGSIQEILKDPEITICIFSHNRATANKFLGQIKTELETNTRLQGLYPEILWSDPYKDAPQWSLEKGISVKRQGNPLNSTIESAGLVDGMPVGSHYLLRVYDDVVTAASVNTPEQVMKATEMYQLSDNLGARGKDGLMREWVIGTRYSFADTYQWIIDNKTLHVRIHAATDDGTRTGNPVFLTREALDLKLAKQQSSVFASQQLLNPAAGAEAMFKREWLKFAEIRPYTLNVYIMVDPAGSKKKSSDNTAISVVGVDSARNKWFLDGYCHRNMSLSQRWTAIRDLRKKWMETPGVQYVSVGYESYSIPDALEHFEERMEIEKNAFEIIVLHWPRQEGGSKNDRIARLEPDFRNGHFYLPRPMLVESPQQVEMRAKGMEHRIFSPVRRLDSEGRRYSMFDTFVGEYTVFPYAQHDDLLDATSRIYDMDPHAPEIINVRDLDPEGFADGA